jgi:pyruvate dehydrogenase E1 component
MREMLERQHDVFFYVTMMNENYAQPNLPDEAHGDVIKGLYRFAPARATRQAQVRLLGSGAILREVIEAQRLLADDWNVHAEVWSATSFSELEREAREVERWNRLHPDAAPRTSHVAACLAGAAPVVAASDSVRGWPQLIAPHLQARFVALGTDGFGRSDTRDALRRFFEVDRHQIVLAALDALAAQGAVERSACARAIVQYRIDIDAAVPWAV